jgi:hypothetical protein
LELLGDGIWDLIDTLGPVNNFNILFANNIFTVCPKHIKLILATDFDNYVKGACLSSSTLLPLAYLDNTGERFRFAMGAVLGSGVFNSDGKSPLLHSLIHFNASLNYPGKMWQ